MLAPRSDPRSSSLITISSHLTSLAKYRISNRRQTDTQLTCRVSTWYRMVIFTQRTSTVPWNFMVFIARSLAEHLEKLLPCSLFFSCFLSFFFSLFTHRQNFCSKKCIPERKEGEEREREKIIQEEKKRIFYKETMVARIL